MQETTPNDQFDIFRLLWILKKRSKLFIVCLVVFLGLTTTYFFLKKDSYTIREYAFSNVTDNNTLALLINELEDHIKNERYRLLAELTGWDKAALNNIKHISAFPSKNSVTDVEILFEVQGQMYMPNLIEGVQHYLMTIPFIESRTKLLNDKLNNIQNEIESELIEIDSLKQNLNPTGVKKDMLLVYPFDLHTATISMVEKNELIREQQAFADVIHLYNSPKVGELSPKRYINTAVLFLGSFAISILFTWFVELLSYIKLQMKQYDEQAA